LFSHLLYLFQANCDVLGLVIFVVPDSTDKIAQVLVEESLQTSLHFHERHLETVFVRTYEFLEYQMKNIDD